MWLKVNDSAHQNDIVYVLMELTGTVDRKMKNLFLMDRQFHYVYYEI